MSFWAEVGKGVTRAAVMAPQGPQRMLTRLYPGVYQTPPKRGTRPPTEPNR